MFVGGPSGIYFYYFSEDDLQWYWLLFFLHKTYLTFSVTFLLETFFFTKVKQEEYKVQCNL